jgi:hypothetical protein
VQNFLFLVDFDFVVVVVETIQETPFALQDLTAVATPTTATPTTPTT